MRDDIHAFIVRIWSEMTDKKGDIVAWRGSIEQVGGQERLYFQDIEKIPLFIRKRLGLASQQAELETHPEDYDNDQKIVTDDNPDLIPRP